MICKVLSFLFFGLAWFVYKSPKDIIRESQVNLTEAGNNKVEVVNGHAKENTVHSTSL